MSPVTSATGPVQSPETPPGPAVCRRQQKGNKPSENSRKPDQHGEGV